MKPRQLPLPGILKRCCACKQLLPLAYFGKNRSTKDGLHFYCKKCHVKAVTRNKPEHASRVYYRRHPELCRERRRRFYMEHRERYRLQAKTDRQLHPDKYREQGRKYSQKYPDKVRANNHKRRAMLLNCEGSYTDREWQNLCAKFDYCCACCGKRKPLTADHVIPLAMRGKNTIDNIQPLCKSCNCRKGKKAIDYRGGIIGNALPPPPPSR